MAPTTWRQAEDRRWRVQAADTAKAEEAKERKGKEVRTRARAIGILRAVLKRTMRRTTIRRTLRLKCNLRVMTTRRHQLRWPVTTATCSLASVEARARGRISTGRTTRIRIMTNNSSTTRSGTRVADEAGHPLVEQIRLITSTGPSRTKRRRSQVLTRTQRRTNSSSIQVAAAGRSISSTTRTTASRSTTSAEVSNIHKATRTNSIRRVVQVADLPQPREATCTTPTTSNILATSHLALAFKAAST